MNPMPPRSKKPPRRRLDLAAWWSGKAPFFRFVLKFCGLLALGYLVLWLPATAHLIEAISVAQAHMAGALLNLVGERTSVTGPLITSGAAAITVSPVCSAAECILFYTCALLAFPESAARKAAGIAMGILLLLLVNLCRIASLGYVKIHFPARFDMVHENLWGIGMLFAVIALFLGWLTWSQWKKRLSTPATGQKKLVLFFCRFAAFFLLFALPWPGVDRASSGVLRRIASVVFSAEDGNRQLAFKTTTDDPRRQHYLRVEISNRLLMHRDGSGPVRYLDLDARSFFWQPMALMLALILATPVPWQRRGIAALAGTAVLTCLGLLFLKFCIWSESSEINLVTFPPAWKTAMFRIEDLWKFQTILTIPVLVWILVTFRRSDFSTPSLPLTNGSDGADRN